MPRGFRCSFRLPRPILVGIALCLLVPAVPEDAHAYEFWPSNAEWAWWPEHCRARYANLPISTGSSFRSQVSSSQMTEWSNGLGQVRRVIHHHCAGEIWLQLAKLTTDDRERKFALNSSLAESQFTLERIPADHPMYGEILTHMGMAERERGNSGAALKYFEQAITIHPKLPGGYQGQALIYRDQRDLAMARDVLLAGDAATEGHDVEIAYFLGLVLFDMKDYERAREYASRAYEIGYPLPGLRDKLARAGYALP